MLDRALEYAKLHKGGKGMSVGTMEKKFKESDVTIYKLIRLGEAPKSVISLIRGKQVSATLVSNAIKASMTPDDVIKLVDGMVKERQDARKKLEDMGYKGGTSITLRRALQMAIDNISKRHLVKGPSRKSIVGVLNSIIKQDKPTVQSIEKAILVY